MTATEVDAQDPLLDIHLLQDLQAYDSQLLDLDQDIEIPYSTVEDEPTTTSTPLGSSMQSPTRSSMGTWEHDNSEYVPHVRAPQAQSPPDFVMAMGLWCINAGVSRADYTALRDVLRMLEPNTQLSSLPETLTTLKRQTKGQLPLLPMRKSNIPLNPAKLPAHSSKLRGSGFTTSPSVPTEDLYFFDPPSLFQAFLSAPSIRERLHVGMAEFRENPSEYWHSRAWSSSIRTTSGQYAHSPLDGQPLFPSDFVTFKCGMLECVCFGGGQERHLGRILEVGRDYREHVTVKGVITLKIQRALGYEDASTLPLNPPMLQNELILTHDFFYVVEDSVIHDNREIHLDYLFGSRVPFSGYSPISGKMTVRRFLDASGNARPLCRSHPIRAELELKEFTRQHFISNFDQQVSRCLSLPLTPFIDGFGLYSNAYRSLMGIYFLMAAFSAKERSRMSNVLPLTLGPHGSNMTDVVNSLHSLFELDGGVWLKINEKDHFVCVFSLCYLGDMPQQAENSGFKSQRGNISCRSCFVPIAQRDNLHFDVSSNGRFHQDSCRMRREMNSKKTKHAREAFATEWGLDSEVALPPIEKLSPALDLVLSRPSDPAHSEYGGMTKLLHAFLVEAILHDNKSRHLYTSQLQRFPSPPGWNRLQSPLHHLGSYTLSEHARWSIIAPPLLRIWLREEHISPFFLLGMQKEFAEELVERSPVDIIVSCFAANAKSNSLLMHTHMTSKDRQDFAILIFRSRTLFQRLCEAAAIGVTVNPRSRQTTPRPAGSTKTKTSKKKTQVKPNTFTDLGASLQRAEDAVSELSQTQSSGATGDSGFSKAKVFRTLKGRPNLHIGLHWTDLMAEYAVPSNCNVLMGEQKHRYDD